jgi:hypothetical protein
VAFATTNARQKGKTGQEINLSSKITFVSTGRVAAVNKIFYERCQQIFRPVSNKFELSNKRIDSSLLRGSASTWGLFNFFV